jgi:hypothetical protein
MGLWVMVGVRRWTMAPPDDYRGDADLTATEKWQGFCDMVIIICGCGAAALLVLPLFGY